MDQHKSRMKKIILIGFLSVLSSACTVDKTKPNDVLSSQLGRSSVVQRNYDKTSIPAGSTFSWFPDLKGVYPDKRLQNVKMDDLLKQGIVNVLVKKGYQFSDDISTADYTVTYTAGLETALSDEYILEKFGAQPGLVTNKELDQDVEKGTLVIDVISQTTGRLRWRSAGQGLAQLGDVPIQQRKSRIEHILNLMFNGL